MTGTRFLGLAITATLVAGIVVVFVKDTTPDLPVAQPTPTPTLTISEPTETPDPIATFEPSATKDPKPVVRPQPPKRDPLPATGLPSQAILAVFALIGAGVLAVERRRTR